MTEIALKRNRSTSIKKVIAFIVLCILLVVLDKVYSLTPSTFAAKTTIHSK
jgi:t-SNARE complex subunit (syntaxin)